MKINNDDFSIWINEKNIDDNICIGEKSARNYTEIQLLPLHFNAIISRNIYNYETN